MTSGLHLCRFCGATEDGYRAQCAACGRWNALVPEGEAGTLNVPLPAHAVAALAPTPLLPTGIAAVDRVFGGLFVGGIYLLAGEAGAGKSTLSLQIAQRWRTSTRRRALYLGAEETQSAMADRAMRVGAPDIVPVAERSLARAAAAVAQTPGGFVVIDSVQKLVVDGAATGGVTAIRQAVDALRDAAEASKATLWCIGHVTKDEEIAGPQTLKHDVDAVGMLTVRAGAHTLRCPDKNRFHPTGRVGWLKMTPRGFEDTAPVLSQAPADLAGRCLCVSDGGLPVEVQAAESARGGLAVGCPGDRAQLLAAQLRLRWGDYLLRADGDALEGDPGADLAIVLALASARLGVPLPPRVAAWGELTLDGRILPPPLGAVRHETAADLGLDPICAPPRCERLDDVLRELGLTKLREIDDTAAAAEDDESEA